jgi:hypothetical protein
LWFYLPAVSLLLAPSCSWAALIERADFSPNATEIDFDSLTSGTPVNDLFLDQGVSFVNAEAVASGNAVSAPNVIASNDGNPLVMNFPGGALQVGIHIDMDGYSGGRQPMMLVYDMLGELLDTQNFGQGPDFLGFEFAVPIGSAELRTIGATGGIGYSDGHDDLIFTLVPEPTTLALAGLAGLAALALLGRCTKTGQV